MALTSVELMKLNGSHAINEVKFQCGICKKSFIICGDRTSEGKIKYFKKSKFTYLLNCLPNLIFYSLQLLKIKMEKYSRYDAPQVLPPLVFLVLIL